MTDVTASATVSELLAAGHDCRYQGDQAGALARFRAAAALAPDDAEAHEALGEVLAETGDAVAAVVALRRAESLDPDRPRRLAALARALADAGDSAAALDICRRWLALAPGSVAALVALGGHLHDQGDTAAAAAAFREAVLLDPDQAEGAARLAALLIALGDPLAALETVQPTLRRRPDDAGLHYQLGRAWHALGESQKAALAWETCLSLDRADGHGAAAALAALDPKAAATSQAPPDATYVRALFDRYAERFDGELLGRLDYQAPALLLEAIRADPTRLQSGLDILDLGCGTGLAGVVLAPLARFMAGVDLAPRMIEQARKRGLYHRLEAADLMTVLAREPGRWDLIVAADVFTYLGALGPVLAAAALALRPGGRLAATLEAASDPAAVEITESRRVRHGETHVRQAAAGLDMLSLTRATLRTENRRPVGGLVFVCAKA